MLNKITLKEREIQRALGLVSWYRVTAANYSDVWRNFVAVSSEDAINQFVTYYRNRRDPIIFDGNSRLLPRHVEVSELLWSIAQGHYKVEIKEWPVDRWARTHREYIDDLA